MTSTAFALLQLAAAVLVSTAAAQGGFCSSANVTVPGVPIGRHALSADGQTLAMSSYIFGVQPFDIYIFTRNKAGAWVMRSTVTDPFARGENNAPFKDLALSEDGGVMAVGYPYNEEVTVFARNSTGHYIFQKHFYRPGGCPADFGASVSLSGSGYRLVVGAPGGFGGCVSAAIFSLPSYPQYGGGAAYVYTRTQGVWGAPFRLVGSDWNQSSASSSSGGLKTGQAVAISRNGATIIVGAPGFQRAIGTAWVYQMVGGQWVQVGPKLNGTAAVGDFGTINRSRGYYVAVDATGATVAMGGLNYYGEEGRAWLFTRARGAYVQQGDPLVAARKVVAPFTQIYRSPVALSGNSSVLVVGNSDGPVRAYVGIAGKNYTQVPLAPSLLAASWHNIPRVSTDGQTLAVLVRDGVQIYTRCAA